MPTPNVSINQNPYVVAPKVIPIANGANYMVTSNFVGRSNFQYNADVFIEGVSVAKLRHNKNVSANNQGIFDVSRVVENYIKTDTQFLDANGATYINPGLVPNVDAYKRFSVKFGVEFDRNVTFTSASSLGGYLFLQYPTPTNLVIPAGNNYLFLTSNNKGIQNVLQVVGYNTSGVYVNYPWNTNLANIQATAIEGFRFYDNYGYTDPVTGVFMLGFVIRQSDYVTGSFNVGDTLYVLQEAGYVYAGYDGEAKCMGTQSVVMGGINYTLVKTNKRVIGSTPANGGLIYSTDKYRFNNLTTSDDSYGIDAGLDYLTYNNWNPNTYRMATGYTGKFLTNKPDRNFKIPPTNKSLTLSMLGSVVMGFGGYNQLQISAFNSAGAALTTFTISVTNSYLRNEIIINPTLLGGYSSAFNAGLNNKTMVYYRVRMYNSGTQVSESFNIFLDYECSRYENYTLKFKNRLGGWDYYNFRARADRKVVIEKSNVRKKLNNYKSSTQKYGYFVGDRGLSTFNVKAHDTYVVNSGYLTNNNAQWLEELFTSPEVYWMNDDLIKEIPITLTQTEMIVGTKKNVGLINYVVEFQASYNKTIQRA